MLENYFGRRIREKNHFRILFILLVYAYNFPYLLLHIIYIYLQMIYFAATEVIIINSFF